MDPYGRSLTPSSIPCDTDDDCTFGPGNSSMMDMICNTDMSALEKCESMPSFDLGWLLGFHSSDFSFNILETDCSEFKDITEAGTCENDSSWDS